MMASASKQRVAKGLCPRCGAEAAPYYLCRKCRSVEMVSRLLNKGVKAGAIKKQVSDEDRRVRLYSLEDGHEEKEWDYRTVVDPDDRRLAPRLRSVPVDVERELVAMFEGAGFPLTTEEILGAWGTLRLRGQRPSAASDLRTIILAQRKRARKVYR